MPPSSNVRSLPTFAPSSLIPNDAVANGAGGVHEALWRQMGADACRATVIDLQTLEPRVGRWMREGGASTGVSEAAELDAAFQGIEAMLAHWTQGPTGADTALQAKMLSPRRWVYFWRLDDRLGVLATVQFLNSRSSSHEFDTAGVRVVCEHWLTADVQAVRQAMTSTLTLPWDQVERRRSAASSRPGLALLLACLAGCLLVAGWLLLGGADRAADEATAQQRERARLAQVADGMVVRNLSRALAGGDYGEVQDVLSLQAAAGHFADTVVTNARGKVVAQSGSPAALPIGAEVPSALRAGARALALTSGTQPIGEVLVLAGPNGAGGSGGPASQAELATGLRMAAALLAALALGAGFVVWRSAVRR